MSGIVGLWNLDGRPVEAELLRRLSARLAHRGPDGEGFWVAGPVALACQLFRVTPESATETQPLVHSSGAVVGFDGRLDNRDELLPLLRESLGISAASPDAALVLAAYEAWGERFPERLNGDFALALFDPRRHRLLLGRDAIGLRPLYYCQTGDTFLFASEIKAILAHPQVSARPNDHMLAHGLLRRLGQDHQDMTFFAGIFRLPPAHLAVLSPQGLTTRQYWDFNPAQPLHRRSFPEYAGQFRQLFEQAVRRRLRSAYPVAVSVSGGLDSSAIFCLGERIRRSAPDHYPPLCGFTKTYPQGSPADENVFILEMEREYGTPIHRVPMGPLEFLQDRETEVWLGESPVIDPQWSHSRHYLSHISNSPCRVLLAGGWGDQHLSNPGYLVDLFNRRNFRELWRHLREFGRWYTDAKPRAFWSIFFNFLLKYHVPEPLIPGLRRLRGRLSRDRLDRPWFTESFRQWAYEADNQKHLRAQFGSAHQKFLYETARSEYYIRGLEKGNQVAAGYGLEIAFPYLDRDLISFLMGIPGEMVCRQGVPKAILREATRGVLPDAIRERRWKGDFTHLVNQGLHQSYADLVGFLKSEARAVQRGYVDEKALEQELSRLKEQIGRRALVPWSLNDLLGLELWLRVFFA